MQGTGDAESGGNKNQAKQDNTTVSNQAAEQARKNNIGDFKPGVKFKLIVDNTIKGASAEYNKKSYHEINVDNTEAHKTVMNDQLFGSFLKQMVAGGLIENGSDVKFKLTGQRTAMSTDGEDLFFKYDLTFQYKGQNVTTPVEIAGGQVVRFTGGHPIDYPLALVGSGVYSQLFKKAIIANAEKELLKNLAPKAEEEFVSFFHKGELEGGVSASRELSTSMDKSTVEALSRNSNKITEFKVPKSVFDKWQFEGSVRSLKDLDKVSGTYNFEWRFSPKLSGQMNNYMVK